jgi:site-specific DNA-adenine methylase
MDALKYALIFAGGVAVGVWGAKAVSDGKIDFRPLATTLVSRGMDVKEALLNKMETLKEDVEDLAAEARLAAEKRKDAPEAGPEAAPEAPQA